MLVVFVFACFGASLMLAEEDGWSVGWLDMRLFECLSRRRLYLDGEERMDNTDDDMPDHTKQFYLPVCLCVLSQVARKDNQFK